MSRLTRGRWFEGKEIAAKHRLEVECPQPATRTVYFGKLLSPGASQDIKGYDGNDQSEIVDLRMRILKRVRTMLLKHLSRAMLERRISSGLSTPKLMRKIL